MKGTTREQRNAELEESLKKKYYRRVGPPIFREVLVGEKGPGSEYRRIDAVRILHARKGSKRFKVNPDTQDHFARLVSGKVVEVIEAKRKLNRSVIGQAIVAKYLFEMKYRKSCAKPVVIYAERDKVLEKICKRIGVKAVLLGGARTR